MQKNFNTELEILSLSLSPHSLSAGTPVPPLLFPPPCCTCPHCPARQVHPLRAGQPGAQCGGEGRGVGVLEPRSRPPRPHPHVPALPKNPDGPKSSLHICVAFCFAFFVVLFLKDSKFTGGNCDPPPFHLLSPFPTWPNQQGLGPHLVHHPGMAGLFRTPFS